MARTAIAERCVLPTGSASEASSLRATGVPAHSQLRSRRTVFVGLASRWRCCQAEIARYRRYYRVLNAASTRVSYIPVWATYRVYLRSCACSLSSGIVHTFTLVHAYSYGCMFQVSISVSITCAEVCEWALTERSLAVALSCMQQLQLWIRVDLMHAQQLSE